MLRRCGKVYQRNRRAIHTSKHVCGVCSGSLVYQGQFDRHGNIRTKRQCNAYGSFVKEHFRTVQQRLPPGTPSQDVMRQLSAAWLARRREAAAVGCDADASGV